eukprot:6129911-Lingulodinium_polyedra.AAC.1
MVGTSSGHIVHAGAAPMGGGSRSSGAGPTPHCRGEGEGEGEEGLRRDAVDRRIHPATGGVAAGAV